MVKAWTRNCNRNLLQHYAVVLVDIHFGTTSNGNKSGTLTSEPFWDHFHVSKMSLMTIFSNRRYSCLDLTGSSFYTPSDIRMDTQKCQNIKHVWTWKRVRFTTTTLCIIKSALWVEIRRTWKPWLQVSRWLSKLLEGNDPVSKFSLPGKNAWGVEGMELMFSENVGWHLAH